ncbi:TlpA family protein disulfide reductase [Sphingobacterium faecale]|uniref:TlpA family protein disulfide reductase n=1 Tax=Sphingobacterium faecale TaxID=2803775 RepID=A0ABS1R8J3_9SPHI|nr:TlpA disulfide reductase family protein [Sphingobacterium faecale]MBL1410998.1 TlpA family protein disulfide reductase [Sphingobacterium faecale]
MSYWERNRKDMRRFLVFLSMVVPFCYMPIYGQSITENKIVNDSLQADLDWKLLGENSTVFTRSPEEYKRYEVGTVFYQKFFEDSISITRMQRAEDFLRKYPDDRRRKQAIIELIQANPRFYSKSQVDNKEELSNSSGVERSLKYSRILRSLQLDHQAEKKWLDETDGYIKELMEHATTQEEKEEAGFLLILRDFNRAIAVFREIGPVNSSELESDYWSSVSCYYWDSLLNRWLRHIKSFPNIALVEPRTVNLLSVLSSFAPKLVSEYWRIIFETTEGRSEIGMVGLNRYAQDFLEVNAAKAKREVSIDFLSMADGKEINLADMRGKVVLVDFWATWCKPCVQELPKLVDLYEKYHDKGFEVIGICLDDESARDRAIKVLEENGARWPQRFQGVGFSSDAYVSLYGISSLPTVWLIDKNGKVVDWNARGEKLENLILQNLK